MMHPRSPELRAWLRRCQAAPPPAHTYPLDVYAHDAAITAALARGFSSLEAARMAKIAMKQARVTCLVCLLYATRAYDDVRVCVDCASSPDAAQRLDTRLHSTEARYTQACDAYDTAYAALDERLRGVWRQIEQARAQGSRAGRWTGTGDPALATKLRRTKEAIDRGDPRIDPRLAALWVAEEYRFWTLEAYNAALEDVTAARAELERVRVLLGQETPS